MILFINTCVENKIILAIKTGATIIKQENISKNNQSEKMILTIDGFFKKNKIDIKKILEIVAVSGPGKFTSARAGVSVANAFAYALKIPVAPLRLDEFYDLRQAFAIADEKIKKAKMGEYISPFYDKTPNIISKKQ